MHGRRRTWPPLSAQEQELVKEEIWKKHEKTVVGEHTVTLT